MWDHADDMDEFKKMEHEYETMDKSDEAATQEAYERLMEMHDILAASHRYTTAAYQGGQQYAALKSLDFVDKTNSRIYLCSVCTRTTGFDNDGFACRCGLAYSGKMWWQGPSAEVRARGPLAPWKFWCRVDWLALLEEYEKSRKAQSSEAG